MLEIETPWTWWKKSIVDVLVFGIKPESTTYLKSKIQDWPAVTRFEPLDAIVACTNLNNH